MWDIEYSMRLVAYVEQMVLSPSLDANSAPFHAETSSCSLILGPADLYPQADALVCLNFPVQPKTVLSEVTSSLTHHTFSQICCLSIQVFHFVVLNFRLLKYKNYKFMPFLMCWMGFLPG